MDKPTLTYAKRWLQTTRKASKTEAFLPIEHFGIDRHSYYCACRDFTEAILNNLITSDKHSPYMSENKANSAQYGSFQLNVEDTNAPKGRQKVTMAIDFICRPPVVFHAFREGSPNLKNGESCFFNKNSPLCKRNSTRPRGRI